MHGHGRRPAYYILGEGVFEEPAYLSGSGHGCPVGSASSKQSTCSPYKFGRMFPRAARRLPASEWDALVKGLIHLGRCMNDPQEYCNQPANKEPEDSTIPSGYTYLGQFIAHEITFDNTQDLPMVEPDPQNLRSPSIDLDSLYGPEPADEESKKLYDEAFPARLKIGWTRTKNHLPALQNDLPRNKETGQAFIGDPRNDENLAVAQTHVALINFHNKVLDKLTATHSSVDLFECARAQVVRHFQWIVLHDYLARMVDADVLDCVIKHGPRWFRVERKEDLYMPLEFSAAAFRMGHSMVRNQYQWNLYHTDGELGPATSLTELFQQTAFSGLINAHERALVSNWVIDWRRFFEFPEKLEGNPEWPSVNKAQMIDTHFTFPLDQMHSFDHQGLPKEKQSITVRNLLRGFALGLPTGEEVAAYVGETPLSHEQVAGGPHREILGAPVFKGKTPLWYYILKEAELSGGSRLGRVGSRLVAETLVGLIKNSRHSVLNDPAWYPSYGRGEPGTTSAKFEMVDLLRFADVVNPLGT